MKSNCRWHDLRNRNTSPRIRTWLSTPSLSMHWWMKRAWSRSASTLTTVSQPRDSNSRDMLPVPEKRSRAVLPSKSIYPQSTLKMFSLAKSVVGLALNARGISNRLPLYLPVITLMLSTNEVGHQVKGHLPNGRDWRTVELGHGVHDVCSLHKSPERVSHPITFGHVAHEV